MLGPIHLQVQGDVEIIIHVATTKMKNVTLL